MNPARHVVICGAGVIGLSTAYYLLERGQKVTISIPVSSPGDFDSGAPRTPPAPTARDRSSGT